LEVGQEVYKHSSAHPADSSQEPVGLVAQAASHAAHGHWALVCLQNSAFEAEVVSSTTDQGAKLTLQPLPYALRDDI
jgi:hypothetical protein